MFMNRTGRAIVLLLLMTGWVRAASAQGGGASANLGDASLADLMKIEITSASGKEQRLLHDPVDDVARPAENRHFTTLRISS